MTMHLCGPALTLIGKKKGKQKFRNAAEAQRARELAADWEKIKSKWAVPPKEKRMGKIRETLQSSGYKLTTPVGRETTHAIPSRDTGGLHVTAPVHRVYTGTKMIGVTVLHKSCLQPVFTEQEAKDAASMRR